MNTSPELLALLRTDHRQLARVLRLLEQQIEAFDEPDAARSAHVHSPLTDRSPLPISFPARPGRRDRGTWV